MQAWLNTNTFCTKRDSIHITSVQKPDSVKVTFVQKPKSMPIFSAKSPLKTSNFCTETEWMKITSTRTWQNTTNFWRNLPQYNFCTKPDAIQISVQNMIQYNFCTKPDTIQITSEKKSVSVQMNSVQNKIHYRSLYKTRLNTNNFCTNSTQYKYLP